MSVVKSFSVGNGDMFYIRHNSSNFTIVDCCLPDDREDEIIAEIKQQSSEKEIVRFVSTHPDQDHISGFCELDDAMDFVNFYCVKNKAMKDDRTADFLRYCKLREDSQKAFYVERGVTRRWMNKASEDRGHAGLHVAWPITADEDYQAALDDAEMGLCPNNISLIMKYLVPDGASFMWMGDLETEFMEVIEDRIDLAPMHIVFAPHHGRKSGRIPGSWLAKIDPKLIVVGEAPWEDLCYYLGYDTLTQNSAGDITFECVDGETHIYVSNENYEVDFLEDYGLKDKYGKYIGTLLTQ